MEAATGGHHEHDARGLPPKTYRRPLLIAGLLLVLIKSIEFALDSETLFCSDSGAYILNALRVLFISFRSYVYGAVISIFALPFHSFRAITGMQMAMGGFTAWLLALALIRFLKVRPWIAIVVAVVFAIDPVQIMYEHMVMTETATLLVESALLVTAMEYLRRPAPIWLIIVSFLGIVLVSLRIVYLPVVLAASVLLPVGRWWPAFARQRRSFALALAVSCGSTALFHVGYQHLTGWLAEREPAYHHRTGFFLVAVVAPLLAPEDASDARVSEAVAAQIQSGLPLHLRPAQLWGADGLVSRLITAFGGDVRQANEAALQIARAAIRRRPLGYLRLALGSYLGYWTNIPNLRTYLEAESGSNFSGLLTDNHSRAVVAAFGPVDSKQGRLRTLSRRYHSLASYWYVFLLLAPFLMGLAFALYPVTRKEVALLLMWNCLLMIATCFGTTETVYRYLHPFSFTALAAVAILGETIIVKRAPSAATIQPVTSS